MVLLLYLAFALVGSLFVLLLLDTVLRLRIGIRMRSRRTGGSSWEGYYDYCRGVGADGRLCIQHTWDEKQ